MVYLHQHQKRSWLDSDRAVTAAFVVATWVVVGGLAFI
jgi:hypothetical protein